MWRYKSGCKTEEKIQVVPCLSGFVKTEDEVIERETEEEVDSLSREVVLFIIIFAMTICFVVSIPYLKG